MKINHFNQMMKHLVRPSREKIMASAKKEISEFFENVIVNDEDLNLKKNRLELLQMLCKTFNNYCNFSKVEGVI